MVYIYNAEQQPMLILIKKAINRQNLSKKILYRQIKLNKKSLLLQLMKLIIKSQSKLKLYSHQLEYDTLFAFIKTEFPDEQDYAITYEDNEGYEIHITSQIDLDALIFQNQDLQFVKIILKRTPGSSEEQEQTDPKQVKKQKRQERKNRQNRQKSEKKHKQRRQKSEKKEKKKVKHKQENNSNQLQKVEEQVVEIETKNPNIHEGIQCSNCKIIPIVGVRYKCLKCLINVCSTCQENFQHQHDLLKIKKHRNQDQGNHEQKEKHNKIKRIQKDPKIKQQQINKKKCKKLSKFFEGEPEKYELFVKNHPELDIPESISLYAKQNNIHLEEKFKDKFQIKINKLSLFFNKPPENYQQFVKDHPQENFRGLIKILKDKGIEDYDNQNFKIMMKKTRQQRQANKSQRIHKKRQYKEKQQEINIGQTPQWQSKSPKRQKLAKSPKKQKNEKTQNKTNIIKQKGRILLIMKDLFGQADSKKYFQFIEKNFQLGEQQIIQKYIQKNFEKKQIH